MTKFNHTAASRHCEQSKAIQRKKPLVLITSFLAMMSCLLFTSCNKEIEFNGEQTDPKLVINSLVEPGHRVEACISKSYFFLDEPNTAAPSDLVASLYVNENHIGEMTPFFDTIWEVYGLNEYHLVPSYYNDYYPQEGDIVKITASAKGFEDVEGETSALPKAVDCQMEVVVEKWSRWYVQNYDEGTGGFVVDSSKWDVSGNLKLTLTITDPNPGEIDYFRLIVDRKSRTNDGENWYSISFDYDDPVFGVDVTENEFIDASDLDTRPEGMFTDVLFDGSSYRLNVKVYFECEIEKNFPLDFFRASFMLEHLSKEYNNYLYTCNQGDEYNQFFAEPVQTYSNVTKGYGIVAGCATDTLSLLLPLSQPQ